MKLKNANEREIYISEIQRRESYDSILIANCYIYINVKQQKTSCEQLEKTEKQREKQIAYICIAEMEEIAVWKLCICGKSLKYMCISREIYEEKWREGNMREEEERNLFIGVK